MEETPKLVDWKKHLWWDTPVTIVVAILFCSALMWMPGLGESKTIQVILFAGMMYFFGKFVWAGSYMIGALIMGQYGHTFKLLSYALVMLLLMFLSIRGIIEMLKLE